MKAADGNMRVDKRDIAMIRAIGKAKGRRGTSRNVIHYLLEEWINADPEENIRILYAGGYLLPVPGYGYRYDQEDNPGEKPERIKLSEYQPRPRYMEIRRVLDIKTGQIVDKPVYPDEFYDAGYEGGREFPDGEEDDDEGEEVYNTSTFPTMHIYVNGEGKMRYSTGPIEDDEEELKAIYNRKTGETKEEYQDYFLTDGEMVVELYEDTDGSLKIKNFDNIVDEEEGEEDDTPSQPEYEAVDGSQILRSDK